MCFAHDQQGVNIMYHCKLKITVFSKNKKLIEMVQSTKALPQFTHEVVVCDAVNLALFRESHIIIWDLAISMIPSTIRQEAQKDAIIIFCTIRKQIDTLNFIDLHAVDELWELPLNIQRAQIDLERILERFKLNYDLYLTKAYLDTAIDSIPDMLWFKALDGTHVKVNKAFCSVVGKTRADVTGKDHCYIWGISPEDYETSAATCSESEEAVIKERRTLQFTEAVQSSEGMRQFRTYKSPIFDRDGSTILGTVGIGHDVTDLVNMSTEIEILLHSMPYAILIWNKSGKIINVNAKFETYFHINKEDIVGMDYGAWNAVAFKDQYVVNNNGSVEAKVWQEDGTEKILEIIEDAIYDIFQNEVGKLCIYRDVTLERGLEERILQSLNTDFLTGLYNRRCFYQYIQENRGKQAVSLFYIDLDQFKLVNDTYGHKVGDAVLYSAAEIIRNFFKEDFVARLGGDEFLVVRLGQCDIAQLKHEAGLLIEKMKDVFQRSKQMCVLSASVGIAQTQNPDMDIDSLLQHSDSALYQAKQTGRSKYCVYQEQDE